MVQGLQHHSKILIATGAAIRMSKGKGILGGFDQSDRLLGWSISGGHPHELFFQL